MNYIKYEPFKFEQNLPLKMYIYKLGDIKPHWNQNIELFYVLEGYLEITVNDRLFILNSDDVFLCNPFDIYELHSREAVVLSAQINLEGLGLSADEREGLLFDCNSSLEKDKSPYQKIKVLISSLINYNLKYQDNSRYGNLSIIYSLFAELMNKYRIISNSKKVTVKKQLLKLREIIKFLNDNYEKSITLKDLSNKYQMTVPYISTFFEKNLGKNFQDYYDELRVSKSIATLVEENTTLNDIALRYGFSDQRGYVRAFKKIHNMSPTEYRRKANSDNTNVNPIISMQFETNKYLDKLLKNNNQKYDLPYKKHKNSVIQSFIADFNSSTPLKKTYLNFFTVARAVDFLSDPIKKMIEELLQDIPFKYVKFNGIFDDTMHVVIKKNNHYNISFLYVDMVLDYILSLNIKPLIQISYMPSAMAENPNNRYENGMIISLPINDDDYLFLVESFIEHIHDRYGDQIESWLFTFWNVPDTSKFAYGLPDDNRFFKLYEGIFKAIKRKNQNLRIGSPSLIPVCNETISFDKKFLKYARDNNCYPDFLIVHYSSNNLSNFFKQIKKEQFSTDPDIFNSFVTFVRSSDFYHGKTIYLTEFNFTTSHRNLLSDTVFSSTYIIKNIVENIDKLDSFGHWYLTDMIDETQIPDDMLHGGLGFFTYNGLKKPSYYAYKFLSSLGNEIILQDKGIIITKENSNKIVILLYNYEHFSNLYACSEYFELSYHNRYIPFAGNKNIVFNICLNNIQGKTYELEQTYVNRYSGSIFDTAEEIGVRSNPSLAVTKALANQSSPKILLSHGAIINNQIQIQTTVEALEIRLLSIKIK